MNSQLVLKLIKLFLLLSFDFYTYIAPVLLIINQSFPKKSY